MKRIKKLISFTIAILFVIAVFMTNVFADDDLIGSGEFSSNDYSPFNSIHMWFGFNSTTFSAATAATVASVATTAATIGCGAVAAANVAVGASDIIEVASNGYNPIREEVFNGNQEAYSTAKTVLNGRIIIKT